MQRGLPEAFHFFLILTIVMRRVRTRGLQIRRVSKISWGYEGMVQILVIDFGPFDAFRDPEKGNFKVIGQFP